MFLGDGAWEQFYLLLPLKALLMSINWKVITALISKSIFFDMESNGFQICFPKNDLISSIEPPRIKTIIREARK